MAETIAVLSLKGGTGKTTTVRTLADVFRRIGLDVLAIDLDPQGNLSDYFDVPPDASPTVADVLSGDAKVKAAAHDGIVPASPILAEVERSLSGKMGRELVLRKALKDARKQHDLILIDSPPALGLLTINALVAAGAVIVPTEARFFSLQGLQMLQESIEEITYLNPRLAILGILLSKLDRRLREERAVAEYLRDRWGGLVFRTEIGTNSKILEAGSAGTSVFRYTGAERAAEMYLALAREVVERG
jgi:chromosome partitioning protein